MKISLPTGKVIDIPLDKYLDLSEAEYEDFIQKMISMDSGMEINDPFAEVYITSESVTSTEDVEIESLPDDIIQEIKKEISDE